MMAFAGFAVSACCVQAQMNVEPFLGASNFSLITKTNANLQTAHIHLGAMIGGNLTLAQSSEFGSRLDDSDLAIWVNGNLNAAGKQLALFGSRYYFQNGLNGATLQSPGTAYATKPYTGSSFSSLFSTLEARSDVFAGALSAPGTTAVSAGYSISGSKLTITAVAGKTNVVNLSTLTAGLSTFWSGQNLEIEYKNVTAETRLIVNYTGSSSANGSLNFNAKTLGLSTDTYDQVIWNFRDLQTLTFGQNADTFHGSILAPKVDVTWSGNDIEGQVVAKSYTSTTSGQIHDHVYWVEAPLTPIPEPSTYGIIGAVALGILVFLRRRRS